MPTPTKHPEAGGKIFSTFICLQYTIWHLFKMFVLVELFNDFLYSESVGFP
jgi:hypothetical protein